MTRDLAWKFVELHYYDSVCLVIAILCIGTLLRDFVKGLNDSWNVLHSVDMQLCNFVIIWLLIGLGLTFLQMSLFSMDSGEVYDVIPSFIQQLYNPFYSRETLEK